jgi:hypothetical protein
MREDGILLHFPPETWGPGMQTNQSGTQFIKVRQTVPYFRRLVAGFPPRRPGFEPRSVHVGFVVDKVEPEQIYPSIIYHPGLIH